MRPLHCCIASILLLCYVVGSCVAAEVTVEKKVNTNAIATVFTTTILTPAAEVMIKVGVIYGDDVEIYTMDKGNYDQYSKKNGANLACVGRVSSGNISYVPILSSNATTQGFSASVPWPKAFTDKTLYLVIGFRDSYCNCATCHKKALVQVKVNLPGLAENKIVQTLIVVGSILGTWALLYGLMRCYQKYSARRLRLKLELEELEMVRLKSTRERERQEKVKAATADGGTSVGTGAHSRRKTEGPLTFDDV